MAIPCRLRVGIMVIEQNIGFEYFAEIVKKKFKPRAARDLQEMLVLLEFTVRVRRTASPQSVLPERRFHNRAPPVEVYACPRRLIPAVFVISQFRMVEVPDLTELRRAYEKFLQQDVPADKREPVD